MVEKAILSAIDDDAMLLSCCKNSAFRCQEVLLFASMFAAFLWHEGVFTPCLDMCYVVVIDIHEDSVVVSPNCGRISLPRGVVSWLKNDTTSSICSIVHQCCS